MEKINRTVLVTFKVIFKKNIFIEIKNKYVCNSAVWTLNNQSVMKLHEHKTDLWCSSFSKEFVRLIQTDSLFVWLLKQGIPNRVCEKTAGGFVS